MRGGLGIFLQYCLCTLFHVEKILTDRIDTDKVGWGCDFCELTKFSVVHAWVLELNTTGTRRWDCPQSFFTIITQ